jgi:phosphoribosylaminoimidazolecarboxamide formyltransferase/IMP cyclohydrolase
VNKKITRALISVSDKSGLIELVENLIANNVEITATDGTAQTLSNAGFSVTSIEKITGFTPILSGRVKTLHPSIYAAVMADLDDPSHTADLAKLNISPIDLVVINFYDTDKFDIGGPSLVRAAVKNAQHVATLTDPTQYTVLTNQLENGIGQDQRNAWAKTALLRVAKYDQAILNKLGDQLRYGENPHQIASVINDDATNGLEILSGKQMSFNNYLDADCALRTINPHLQPTVAIIKHATPCGVATAPDLATALTAAISSDPISVFGGVIATNRRLETDVANLIAKNFYEVIIAPGYTDAALQILRNKENLRIIGVKKNNPSKFEIRQIINGYLFQQSDQFNQVGDDFKSWKLVCGKLVSKEIEEDLSFAWKVVKNVRSNGIVVANDLKTIGIGMGQTNRVDSVKHALERAGSKANGAVLASDGFFPFADSIELMIAAGIVAIVQPGGSVKDDEVIKACNQANISMFFTQIRHFSH